MMLFIALRGPVAERLSPVAEAEALRLQAEAALQQGRLSAADGSGARELYEAAVAIDPDRAELRSGLTRVAQAAVQQARAAAERIGNRSLTLSHRIVDAAGETQTLYPNGQSVLVWIEIASGRPIPLPEDIRAAAAADNILGQPKPISRAAFSASISVGA